jgi:hypothetical protein
MKLQENGYIRIIVRLPSCLGGEGPGQQRGRQSPFFDFYRPDENSQSRSFEETGKGQPRTQDSKFVESVIGCERLSIVTVRSSINPPN